MKSRTGLLRWVALAGIALGLEACAAVAPTEPVEGYAHRTTRGGALEVYWSCTRPEPGLLQVAGIAISPFFPSPVQDLEFRLDGIDGRGTIVSKVQGAARDHLIPMMVRSPFRLTLRTTGTEARFDLSYSYVLQEGGGIDGANQPLEHTNMEKNVCPPEKP